MKRILVYISSSLFFGGLAFYTAGYFLYGQSTVAFDLKKNHHGNGSFVSTSTAPFFDWLKMRIKRGRYPEIDAAELKSITVPADLALIQSPSAVPRATWIGHATVLVQYNNVHFLTDPHLTERPGPVDLFFPKRMTPPALSYADLPKIDFIVISHNHYDHLDHRTVDMFANSVLWYVPVGLKAWFVKRGINPARVVELDWWQSHKFDTDVEITFTPGVHWSKRTPWDTNKSLWGSWSVRIGQFKTWYAGDTAYDEKLFTELGAKAGPFNLALLPIGAYDPR